MSMDEATERSWVYLGVRISTKGKRMYAWADIEDLDNGFLFSKNVVSSSAGVGSIFKVWSDGSTIYYGGERMPRFAGEYEGPERAIWAAKDEAARQELSIKSLNTKAEKVEPLEDILAPLRRVARGLNDTERRALAARVIQTVMWA